jgi:predicted aminopeptidase
MRAAPLIRVAVLTCVCAATGGCYYLQAAHGQYRLMRAREPIEAVLRAPETPPGLADRLRLVEEARAFSIKELGLPDNDSYRSYADIGRDYVVWNVFAAPEFSLRAKTWCFPVAGCVGYHGYFAEASAQREAEKLAQRGDDVAVVGVAAYSTLGRFGDPVLNTMMRWGDVDLVAVMFHELAHELIYVKGQTTFDESFATAVEEFGIERWLDEHGSPEDLAAYRAEKALRQQLSQLAQAAGTDLEAIYSADLAADVRRERKRERFGQLAGDMRAAFSRAGREAPAWLDGGLNNARLASLAMYTARLDEFRALLADCDDDLPCFYDKVRKLAEDL